MSDLVRPDPRILVRDFELMAYACSQVCNTNRVLAFSMGLTVYNIGGVPVPRMQIFWYIWTSATVS